MFKDRVANRTERRVKRRNDHEPLLRLVKEEITRKPTRAKHTEIKPMTETQRLYDAAIKANIITFATGPAGTGKTWLAAARAADALRAGEIERIIVTRPAVEAGESMGFLPGEMDEKFEPYFRPVRDVFEERLGSGQLEYFLKNKIIEARPLAYLRGATFKNSWILFDEAQNTTPVQMKLFLTRIGNDTKVIITGDLAQKDIAGMSGLQDALARLKGVRNIAEVHFEIADIVRSGICRDIVIAYEGGEEDVAGLKRTIRA